MSEVPHLLGVSRLWSLSLPLVLSLHVPMCLWENGPPLSVPMADPLPADASLGTSAPGGGCISVTLPVALFAAALPRLSRTHLSLSLFLLWGRVSPNLSCYLCVASWTSPLSAGFLWLSLSLWGDLCVSLSASQTLHRCLAAHLSVCLDLLAWVWVSAAPSLSVPKSVSALAPPAPIFSSPSPHLSASHGPPRPPRPAARPRSQQSVSAPAAGRGGGGRGRQ